MRGIDEQKLDELILEKYTESLHNLQQARRTLYEADLAVKEATEEIQECSIKLGNYIVNSLWRTG